MTSTKRSREIFSVEVPVVYSNEDKQSKYATGYHNGMLFVNNCQGDEESLNIRNLKDLCEEYIRGYCDGIRDEILFQQKQEE